jgi:hypothetical protein
VPEPHLVDPAPPRVGFFFKADVVALEEFPYGSATACNPMVVHGTDHFIQRQVRLFLNQCEHTWPYAAGQSHLRSARRVPAQNGPFHDDRSIVTPLGCARNRPSSRYSLASFSFIDEPEPGALVEPRHVDAVHTTLLRRKRQGRVERPKHAN